jgi:hypothetical protein
VNREAAARCTRAAHTLRTRAAAAASLSLLLRCVAASLRGSGVVEMSPALSPPPPLPPPRPLRPPPPPPLAPYPQVFDEIKAQAYPNEPDLILMLLLPSALAGFLAVGRLARSRYIDSFEHLSSSYDKPSMSSYLGTLGSITLALVQLLMYGAFLNRFASAGTELTVPWFNAAVLGQFANYFVTVMGDYIKLFFFATEARFLARSRGFCSAPCLTQCRSL